MPLRVGYMLALLLLAVACGDAKVCEGPDCGPHEPPASGEPQGPPWDTDGDSISNNTEVHPPNSIYGFRVDTADLNPSKSFGTPSSFGSLDSAINLPNEGTGYVHHWGTDATETDDWGHLWLINVIEGAGRHFDIPNGFSGTCRFYSQHSLLPRMQVGDLSLQHGGYWSDHDSHQNGRDVDVRYLRDDHEGQMNFEVPADSIHFDAARTADLLTCFLDDPRVELIYYDQNYTGYAPQERLIHWPNHHHHFHVRIKAP